ncbi:MAG: hypothetical protein D6722_29065 [Bacteroidetes bacterium]|nr:MAG: hypothetical protein D6722_29065 [Bacteroidota bacterium]
MPCPDLSIRAKGKSSFRLSGKNFRGKLIISSPMGCTITHMELFLEASYPLMGQDLHRVYSRKTLPLFLKLDPDKLEEVAFSLPLPPLAPTERNTAQHAIRRLGGEFYLEVRVDVADGGFVTQKLPVEAWP